MGKDQPKPIQILIRVPMPVKQWLKRQSERNGSSQSFEVVRCIRDRMDAERRARAVERT